MGKKGDTTEEVQKVECFAVNNNKSIPFAECLRMGSAYKRNLDVCTKNNCTSFCRLCPTCITNGLKGDLMVTYPKYVVIPGTGHCKDHQTPEEKAQATFYCPEYRTEISRERCINTSGHSDQNGKCAGHECESPWRICVVCVKFHSCKTE